MPAEKFESNIDKYLLEIPEIEYFKNLIVIIRRYHYHRCGKEECPYCNSFKGLILIYCDFKMLQSKNIDRLHAYCFLNEAVFCSITNFVSWLADIEKEKTCSRKRI